MEQSPIQKVIECFYKNGAMYAYAPGKPFEEVPIELGDKVLYPGQFVQKLGEKKRSKFEMQEGFYLRYVGKAEKLILFSVNDTESDYYYAFAYIDKNTLLIVNNGRAWDIRLNSLEIYDDFPKRSEKELRYEQLTLF